MTVKKEKPKIIVIGQPGFNPAEMLKKVDRLPGDILLINTRDKTGSFTGVAAGPSAPLRMKIEKRKK